MSAGPRNYLTPTEPNENKGGFRKIKRGEGQSSVWGGAGPSASDRKMAVLGWLLILIASGVPVFLFWASLNGPGWSGGMVAASLVLTHLFLIVSEMVTHRELPTRGRAMVICWGSFLVLSIVGAFVS